MRNIWIKNAKNIVFTGTPVKITKVDYPSRDKAVIKQAFFTVPSTTDYNGLYKGRYIDFEAKETKSKTAFALTNIHPHQIKHLENIDNNGGIAFIIVRFTTLNETYLITAERFLNYINNNDKKSVPLEYFKTDACSWLVTKRNEVLKEHPFKLEKQLQVTIYLSHEANICFSKCYTIENEITYSSLIDTIKKIISSIPSIEVFFSVEFIYKEQNSNINLFSRITEGINVMFAFFKDFENQIKVKPSKARKQIIDKIKNLQFYSKIAMNILKIINFG